MGSEGSRPFFAKKAPEKLLLPRALEIARPAPRLSKRFLVTFFQKRNRLWLTALKPIKV
jgi:hypothetical protein